MQTREEWAKLWKDPFSSYRCRPNDGKSPTVSATVFNNCHQTKHLTVNDKTFRENHFTNDDLKGEYSRRWFQSKYKPSIPR